MAFSFHKQRITRQASKNFCIMKPEQTHIDQIRISFGKIQSKEDFLQLLNDVKPMIYGVKTVPFELKQITWYSNPRLRGNRYAEFKIKKKSGGDRTIHSPVNGLKAIQKTLSFILQCVFDPHEAATGFVRNRSIVDNARIHAGSRYVYNIDLKDFFQSIDQARVWKCLQLLPFNLTKESTVKPKYMKWEDFKREKLKTDKPVTANPGNGRMFIRTPSGIILIASNFDATKEKFVIRGDNRLVTKEGVSLKGTLWLTNHIPSANRLAVANIIAALCCTEMDVERRNEQGDWIMVRRNVLPQGAPTSPVITNIICQRLDYLLAGTAKRFGLKYSRYADDITFSSDHNVYNPESDFVKELQRIITDQGFHVRESKTRLQKETYRQEVTGLLVNEKVNVQKRYIKQLRLWLYYWERYGYDRAYGFFIRQYLTDKGHIKKGNPDMASVISGKLDFLKMVKGGDSEMYLNLKARFAILIPIKNNEKVRTDYSKMDSNNKTLEPKAIFESEAGNPENLTDKLRIIINPLDSEQLPAKLKRKIIIDKGEPLPFEEYLENLESEEKVVDLTKHKPKDVARFILSFSSSEGLKFLTHDYDKPGSIYDYKEILETAREEFNDLSSRLVIPKRLWMRINQFAFGDPAKHWWFNEVQHKICWKSPELISWIESHKNTHPIKNKRFEEDFILPFKRSIEIKPRELEVIIKTKLVRNLESKFSSFDIEYPDLTNANFYTDVDAMQAGISYLIKAIRQRADNSNKIRVEFSSKSDIEGRKKIIKIIHVGSVCDKSLDKTELFHGDLLEAEKALFGICDWSIIARSTDDSFNKLNVLYDISSDMIPREKIDESLIEGFTHVLTFYK